MSSIAEALFLKRLAASTVLSTANFTRPADTTTYTSGDVVSNSTTAATILTFPGMARAAGGGGILQGAVLSMSTVPSLKLDADLFLFDTTVTMQNDNVAFACSDAEIKTAVACIRFSGGNARVGANNVLITTGAISEPFVCAAGVTSLYGILVARNAYIPGNAEEFNIRLLLSRD